MGARKPLFSRDSGIEFFHGEQCCVVSTCCDSDGNEIATNYFTVQNNGDTDFTLSNPHVSGKFAVAFVNGVQYDFGTSFTISGTNFVWQDDPITLSAGNRLTVSFIAE